MGKKPRKPKWPNISAHYRSRSMNEGDIAILEFLWKWKVSAARVLHEANLQHEKPEMFNRRLRKLERNKMIRSQYDMMTGFHLWQLADFGLHTIRESLGEIRDHNFLSESPNHDRLVQTFQLGEWLWDKRKPIMVTDQELLKYRPAILERLVSHKGDHRPDGYVRIKNEKEDRLFAIEVELHAKAPERYCSLLQWYRPRFDIQQVLWLVDNPRIIDQVRRAKDLAQDKSVRYHVFVDLADYLENGWDAAVTDEFLVKLYHLRQIFEGNTQGLCGAYAGNHGTWNRISIFSDRRKYLEIPKTYPNSEISPKS